MLLKLSAPIVDDGSLFEELKNILETTKVHSEPWSDAVLVSE